MFIPVHTHIPTPTQTKHSRELGRRVEHLIREYQREYPEMTEDEIRAALARSSVTGNDVAPAVRRVLGVSVGVLAMLVAGIFAAVSSSGARSGAGGGALTWAIVAGLIVVLAGVAALVAATRR